jgi:hypothetical protein
MRIAALFALGAVLTLGACASSYAPDTWTGGYREEPVSGDVWRITFLGNGFTTDETVQTYWLYHCADFALSKGYDGFTIVSPVNLSSVEGLEPVGKPRIVRTRGGGSGGGYVVVGVGGGAEPYKPWIVANILLLKKPFVPVPARTFDAAALKTLLDAHVNGAKCDGNVCPYVHTYLFPPEKGS